MLLAFSLCLERKGRTIQLLKQSSKPVPKDRKRRKINFVATPEQFAAMHEESKQEDVDMEAAALKFRDWTREPKRKETPDRQQAQQ